MQARLGLNALFLISGLMVAGCSLALDPSYCESDNECQGGVCTNGVCVSSSPPSVDMSQPDGGSVDPDIGPGADSAVQVDAASPDAEIQADAQPDVRTMIPPECEITVETNLTDQPDIEVSVSIIDGDDTAETITATINGAELTLNRMLEYRGFIDLSEGENVINLLVTDRDEQTCEGSVIVDSDRTGPTIEMLDPGDGEQVLTNQREVTVRGSVSDLHFDNALNVYVDDQLFAPDPPIEWASGMFLFTIPLMDGEQDVELVAVDRVGNESDPAGFIIESDVVPPTVTLQSPVQDDQIGVSQRRYLVQGTVEDNNRVVRNPRVTITVANDGGEQAYDMPVARVDGSFEQYVELANGLNTITACGLDDAGNEHCVAGSVDKEAPCINVESPQEGDFVGSLTVRLSGTVCAGVDVVEAAVDGGALVAGEIAGDHFSIEVRALQAGAHEIVVTARNSDGEEAAQVVNVNIDTSPPNLQVFEPDDAVCVSGSVEVSGQVQDDRSGIREVRINATPVEDIDLGGGFRQMVPVLDGEEVELRVVAVNGAGLETTRVKTVRGDSVAPQASFDIMNPLIRNNPWLAPNAAGRIRLTGRVEGGTCGLSQGGFVVDDLPVDVVQNSFQFERVYQHGPHTAHWVARDVAGNVREGDYPFRVDSLPPTIHVVSPVSGAYQSSDTAHVSVELDDVGVGFYQLRVNGEHIPHVQGPNGLIAETNVGDLQEGPNTIRIEAEDEVGNETVIEVTVNRDVTPVQVGITHPEAGIAAPIPLTVTGTATDGEMGSGVQGIVVNGVDAEYNPGEGTWVAHGVVVTADDPQITVLATDMAANELPEPFVFAVPVHAYGRQTQAMDGLTTAASVGWLSISDINIDGLPDILALSGTGDGVSSSYIQIMNNAFVGRGPRASGIPSEFGFSGAVLGDVDADGRLDLVATGDGGSYFLKGMGNGSFRSGEFALPSLAGLVLPSLVDINRDGRLDLLLSGSAEDARLYFGDRDSLLAAEDVGAFGLSDLTTFTGVSGSDVDGDGVIDLVALGPDGGQLWLGDRDDFNFTVRDASGLEQAPDGVTTALWLDVNQDGVLDVFTYGEAGASLHLADGDGEFALVDRGLEWRATDRVATVADFDGDGRDDLIIGGSEGLRFFRNAEAGFLSVDTPIPFDGAVTAIAADDIDFDGDVDLAIGSDSGVHLVRSNRAQLSGLSRAIHLSVVRHQLPPNNAENPSVDAVGAIVYVQFLSQEQLDDPQIGAANFEPTRAIRANPAGATLITLGDAAGARLKVHYVDLGGRGSNTRSFLGGVEAGAILTSYARE